MSSKQYSTSVMIAILIAISTVIPLATATTANISIDFIKTGNCNSSILVRVGDFCDFSVTITIMGFGSSTNSTDLNVEIIMPDTNSTSVMEINKPSISYVGSNFVNPSVLYATPITLSSLSNSTQYDYARINFGTIVNPRLVAPNNNTENSIIISFRSIVVYNPMFQANGTEYWLTVGAEYNNFSEIWIGQALFVFTNASLARTGQLIIGTVMNSSLQIPQGSPFKLVIPIHYNATYALNFIFSITNNNPTNIGLCAIYIDTSTDGFSHIYTLGDEIATSFTSALINNRITLNLAQIVNTQSYTGTTSTLNIAVHGRVFKKDGVSSFAAGTLSARVSATSSVAATTNFTIYSRGSVMMESYNGSLPTYSITSISNTVSMYQSVKMRIQMVVPSSFSAPVIIDLSGTSNTSSSILKACSVIFQSAGENVAGSKPECVDTSIDRMTYSSSTDSIYHDELSYDFGVIENLGSRSTNYANDVNTIVFDAIFQLLNVSNMVVWPSVMMSIGNNTIWLGTASVNVTTSNYNVTNTTRPTFDLIYADNSTTNQSAIETGITNVFYLDIFTKPNGIYSPMQLHIATNEVMAGNNLPASTICQVKVLYVGENVACMVQSLFNQPGFPMITYASRFNQRKYDTAYVELGPLCNYATSQTDSNLGRVRLAIYFKLERDLTVNQSTNVNLDVYYSPSETWVGQVSFLATSPTSVRNVVGSPLLFSLSSSTQSFYRNQLTIVKYGLKIPPGSMGTYSSMTSSILNEGSEQTSVCRVDIASERGRNVPCAVDTMSTFSYNANGFSSSAMTNFEPICSISANGSSVNGSLMTDEDTVNIQVYILATLQTSSTFNLTLSNLIPSGQASLAPATVTLSNSTTSNFGNVSSVNFLNTSRYQQANDNNSQSSAFLGQDLMVRTQISLSSSTMKETCYNLVIQFSITAATMDAAYFTNAFLVSSGDHLMCFKKQPHPVLTSGGSSFYNTLMHLDLGTFCYYPTNPFNATSNILTIQGNLRLPMTTSVSLNSPFSVNIAALINNNQTAINTSIPFTVMNHTNFLAHLAMSNDTPIASIDNINSTVKSAIRQSMTYKFKIYIPLNAQGRLQLWIQSNAVGGAITINLLSVEILSAGINVGSFMSEYQLNNRYVWQYSRSIAQSTYQDRAYLDLGVVTNSAVTAMRPNISNSTDNYIYLQATGYLTDSPLAEENFSFDFVLMATYGSMNISTSYSHQVIRNGTERPLMYINHTDLSSGNYGPGATYIGIMQYGHELQSNADCINGRIILYLPSWIHLINFNASSSAVNYTTDNSSYASFEIGSLSFYDVGSITFRLQIEASNTIALVYKRYYSPRLTIPYELMCNKQIRNNTSVYPASKVFGFPNFISLPVSITQGSPNLTSLLGDLQPCQFSSSVPGSDASLARSIGWNTGFRSNRWMLSGSTFLQISFGNITTVHTILLNVPSSYAPIRTIQLGYSWDGIGFAMDPKAYHLNGSSSYSIQLTNPLTIRYLRVYVIDVVQPTDLLTRPSGFSLNITGETNATGVTIADVCKNQSSLLSTRTILVAPRSQTGLTYFEDVYVCDESTTRESFQCFVLHNGIVSGSGKWTALNTSVANIVLFAYDPIEQIQYLYGHGQDGRSIMRSNDRGQTWFLTSPSEFALVDQDCQTFVKVCTHSDSYSITGGAPGWLTLQNGFISWSASIRGLWTQQVGGILAFDWFG